MGEIVISAAKTTAKNSDNKVSQKKTEVAQIADSPAEQVLFLQRTIGNKAVERHIRSGNLQAKLRIGQPGDIYEQEADRVAEQVMRMPLQTTHVKSSYHFAKSHSCKEKEEILQAEKLSNEVAQTTPPVESQINSLRTGGQPLPVDVSAFFETRFGTDFSRVRVHSDASAEQSAQDMDAKAYTVDNNIVFGAGMFVPETTEGRRLIAHELAHVVQQGAALRRTPQMSMSATSLQIQCSPNDPAVGETFIVKTAKGGNLLLRVQPIPDQYLGGDRSKPNTVGNIRSGTTVTIKEKRQYDWYVVEAETIEYGKRVGFVNKQYLNPVVTGESKPAGQTSVPAGQTSSPASYDVGQDALEQCIAELGGSTGYRDGGIASTEELESYRQECLKRTGLSGLSKAIENLGRAWEYAKQDLRPEILREVENLFSPTSLALIAAFALVYIASQLTPVGWIADALAIITIAATVIFVGMLAIDIARDLFRFFSAVNATSEEELKSSGKALARALVRGGIGILIALLTRGMRGPTRPSPPTTPSTAMVEVVAAGVGRVRVPVAATAGEAVQASRLQGLASYAVMVPPPGGAEPSSPSLSSSSGGRSGSGRGSSSERGRESGGQSGGSEIGHAGGFRLSRINYGEGALSQLAQRMRIMLGLRRGGNVAVFEFENIPANFRSLVTRLGGKNVHIEGNRMAVQNVDGSAHSEKLAHMLITEGRRGGIELNVRRIYTEYNPCTDKCLPLIRTNYPSAEVTFSFIWELWGRQTPDRNAAVDALFGQAGGR